MAVVLPATDEEASHVMAAALLATLASAALALLVALPFHDALAVMLGNRDIAPWLPLVAASLVFINAYQILSYWTTRKGQYQRLAISRVSRAVAIAGANLTGGMLHAGASGLVAGAVTGQAVGAVTLAWQTLRDGTLRLRDVRWEGVRTAAHRHREFPLFAAPTSLLNSAATQAPVFLLTHAFGSRTAGQFSLTALVIAAPAALLASSVQQVYYQRIAALRSTRPELLRGYLLRTAGSLAAIAILPLLLLLALGPMLFTTVFGPEWRTAGEFARIVAFAAAINFVVSPVSSMLSVSGNITVGAAWKCVYFVTTVTALSIASRFSVRTFLGIYAVHQVVLYGVYFLLILRAASAVRARLSDSP